MKTNYEQIGRVVTHVYPELANVIIQKCKHEPILKDFKDIAQVANAFHEVTMSCIQKDVPKIKNQSERTRNRTVFIAAAIYCYAPECFSPIIKKHLPWGLATKLSSFIGIPRPQVCNYVSRIRVYISAYDDFKIDVQQIVAIVKHGKKG